MIARLKGLVDSVGSDSAVIDVNGVGYLVFASSRTLGRLGRGGGRYRGAAQLCRHHRDKLAQPRSYFEP